MSLTADFVIVGGGVIGCAIASELSESGASVILVERGDIAGESSSAAAGLLVPLHAAQGSARSPLLDFFLESTRRYSALVPELERRSGLQLEFEERGSYRVAVGDEEGQRLRSDFRDWEALGSLRVEWLQYSYAPTRGCRGSPQGTQQEPRRRSERPPFHHRAQPRWQHRALCAQGGEVT